MITVTVTGQDAERKRVTDAIRTALAGSRYIVRRYALDVEPDPLDLDPDLAGAMDVTLLESSKPAAGRDMFELHLWLDHQLFSRGQSREAIHAIVQSETAPLMADLATLIHERLASEPR